MSGALNDLHFPSSELKSEIDYKENITHDDMAIKFALKFQD